MARSLRPLLSVLLSVCAVSSGAATLDLLTAGGASVPLGEAAGYANAHLVVAGPGNLILERDLAANAGTRFALAGVDLPDGEYRYRVDFSGAGTIAPVAGGSTNADGREAPRRPGPALAALEGSFRIEAGRVYARDPAAIERASVASTNAPQATNQVIAEDLIVQGSGCFGLDCVSGESFGFDTLRLKENNTRLKFDDTSSSAGFSANDWQLTANDPASGGLSRFSIEDVTGATVPFTVLAGAPSNAVYIANTGKVGFRTTTPGLDLHIHTSDTPAIRFDQDNADGFVAQTWDIGANEANFFVRDLTGGSRLPFRIRRGAPTSSLDIAASGQVGIGTASPAAQLDVFKAVAAGTPEALLQVRNSSYSSASGEDVRFAVDSDGNVTARGTIAQLSSRRAKENFVPADGKRLLARLERMPITSWNYRGAPADDRHLGPVAEDFHAAFGLGRTDRYVAPSDLAGVALASVKALQEEVRERDRRIADLEARLQELEDLVRRQASR